MSKKKRVKSKAAKATAEKRAERKGPSGDPDKAGQVESVEWKGGGGMMTGLRGGFQTAVSSASDSAQGKKKGGMLNTILWIAVIAGAAAFMMGR